MATTKYCLFSTILLLSFVFVSSITAIFLLGHLSCKATETHSLAALITCSESRSRTFITEIISTHLRSYKLKAALFSKSPSYRNHKISKMEKRLEQGLARARREIKKAAVTMKNNHSASLIMDEYDISFSAIYQNPPAFIKSYREMERRLKVYVYQEGELPIVHDGPCKDIYSIEGRFIHEIEHGKNRFRTSDPKSAHVFFMPFSVTWMVRFFYRAREYDVSPLQEFVHDYVKLVSTKHPFWNRTQGADHFMLSCHDWAPAATKGNRFVYNTSIRVLCNANTSEGFSPQKDVSLPELHLYGGFVNPKLVSPPSTSPRPYLAFFAGGNHGHIRKALLAHWKGKDHDIKVYDYLTKAEEDYYDYMLRSKFCLCPSGYEVASPRIVEAIYAECVPVILSDHYVLPFSDVLRWEAFSIRASVSNIPQMKQLLAGISEDEYVKLKTGLRAVRRHFVWNRPIRRFDMFTMILHSVWLRRLNLQLE